MKKRASHAGPRESGYEQKYRTSDPHGLGDVLSELFARRGYGKPQGDQQLRQAWAEVVGELLAKNTRVRCLRNGVLEIGVANSALLSQLTSFQRIELLDQLQTRHPQLKIRDLKFRLQSSIQ